jgi:hypothetical protein
MEIETPLPRPFGLSSVQPRSPLYLQLLRVAAARQSIARLGSSLLKWAPLWLAIQPHEQLLVQEIWDPTASESRLLHRL